VYVTLGTIFNEALGIFRAILEGLSEADLNVVVTIGRDGDPAALGTLPSSVPGWSATSRNHCCCHIATL